MDYEESRRAVALWYGNATGTDTERLRQMKTALLDAGCVAMRERFGSSGSAGPIELHPLLAPTLREINEEARHRILAGIELILQTGRNFDVPHGLSESILAGKNLASGETEAALADAFVKLLNPYLTEVLGELDAMPPSVRSSIRSALRTMWKCGYVEGGFSPEKFDDFARGIQELWNRHAKHIYYRCGGR